MADHCGLTNIALAYAIFLSYAFKQSLIKLADKQRHYTAGEIQVDAAQRLSKDHWEASFSASETKHQEKVNKSSLDTVNRSSCEQSSQAKSHTSSLPEKSVSSEKNSQLRLCALRVQRKVFSEVKCRADFDATDEDRKDKTPPTKAEAALKCFEFIQKPCCLENLWNNKLRASWSVAVRLSRLQMLAMSRENKAAAKQEWDSSKKKWKKSTAAKCCKRFEKAWLLPMNKSKPT